MDITTKNIYEKLEEARKLIRETNVKKDGHNDFSKYSYFTPEAVEQLVAMACEKTRTTCITNLKADVNGIFQEMEFINLDDLNDRIVFQLRTAEADMTATNRAQKMGGTDTYSERYIKQKVFQIKDNSLDFDAQDNRQAPAAKPVVKGYNVNVITAQLQAAPTLATMRAIWEALPGEAKDELAPLKDSLKAKLQRQTERKEGDA